MKVEGVTQVAMESTGVYRKPICNIREGNFEVLLGNGQKLKHVPGHKTDIQDGQWIAPRLQPGRFQGSLIPPRWQRELRDLTGQRAQGIGEPSRTVHRMQKVLEDAKLKLGGVASEVVGVSGRRRLRAIIAGESNPEQLADLAQRQLRGKIPQVPEARFDNITEQPRWRLSLLWDQRSAAETFIARLDERIAQLPRPPQPALEKVDAIAGIDRRVAEVGLAEIGPDRSPFPSAAHLACWAGMCPGNNQSPQSVAQGQRKQSILR